MTSARPTPGLVADGAAVLVRGSPDPEHDCPATRALPVGMLSSHDSLALRSPFAIWSVQVLAGLDGRVLQGLLHQVADCLGGRRSRLAVGPGELIGKVDVHAVGIQLGAVHAHVEARGAAIEVPLGRGIGCPRSR